MRRTSGPQLSALHSLMERNYALLRQLFPAGATPGSGRLVQVGENLEYELELLFQAPYTTDIIITQTRPEYGSQVLHTQFGVRLYHDAHMAEVSSWQQAVRLQALQPHNHHDAGQGRAEKYHLNELLGDWLRMCLRQGRTPWEALLAV